MPVDIYGIRHHGPGSARSLLRALETALPDVILVEGPPDADSVLPFLVDPKMRPPVALLIYEQDDPKRHAFYPFAVFSPEWQAIRFGLTRGIPVRFMDLPQTHQLALARQEETAVPGEESGQASEEAGEQPAADGNGASSGNGHASPEEENAVCAIERDPMVWMARAAGFEDAERWWEYMVEHRREGHELFEAILEAMTALRAELPQEHCPGEARREAMREAWMRQSIRAAQKEGHERVAVVCGAWHGPALAKMPPAKDDAALLKGLPKVKVQTTWAPWTYGRLSQASGYGAGVQSPGWYHHLWSCGEAGKGTTQISIDWLTRVARLLREQDLDASSASVIEAVRLAEAVAAMRGLPLPGLEELKEAVRTTLCFGDDLPMRLIGEKLIVGDRMGEVPPDTPAVALQQDLAKLVKRLRLPQLADTKEYDLDLRKANDLERSRLLHRMNLLGIEWGEMNSASGRVKGTFHELWRLQWQPEFSVRLIEASMWGTTVYDAATARARSRAGRGAKLPALTSLVDAVLLADLPEAVAFVMRRMEAEAAVAGDVAQLMDAVPPLANVLRYGNVRQTDTRVIERVVDGMVARICVGLGLACSSLDDEAAEEMLQRLQAVDGAVRLLQKDEQQEEWTRTLERVSAQQGLHGLIAGKGVRILLDAGSLDTEEAARRLGLALSTASDPGQAGAWADGFLRGSGLVLLLDEKLWSVLDSWVGGLHGDTFTAILPLLRRTFGSFAAGERRQIGERVKQGERPSVAASIHDSGAFDREAAEATLPLLEKIVLEVAHV